MPADVDIEWIVCEVIRRLRAQEQQAAMNRKEPSLAETQRVVTSIKIAEPVITLSTLDKQLDGIERVIVSTRAVVTPSVVDALKDRNIELVRCEKMSH